MSENGTTNTTAAIQGSCLCGNITFEVAPDAQPMVSFNCHCNTCKKISGGAFLTLAAVKRDDIKGLEVAMDRAQWYASSDFGRRGFCPKCSSAPFFEVAPMPEHMFLALGSLSNVPSSFKPTSHIFYDQHAEWLTMSDKLPKHKTNARSELVQEEDLRQRQHQQ